MIRYESDGLAVYARLDTPNVPMPPHGHPVVVFLHGWAGIDKAPGLDFYYGAESQYGRWIERYIDAGFVVVTPGFRGHGTVNGRAADGLAFMAAWDNGSYLSPVFYAIDVLNLVDGLDSLDVELATTGSDPPVAQWRVDPASIHLVGHSQGGDVALIAMAVSGEGSALRNSIRAASIWSGTFPSRSTQLEVYYPMQSTTEAFLSGDGTWNGTAVGSDGSVNPNFVFGYPPDWIGSVNPADWTWQSDYWSLPSVADAWRIKLDEMYGAINRHVGDIDDADYRIVSDDDGRVSIGHDARVAAAMADVGAFDRARFLTEPLALHHSDRDFYSLPAWNADLCRRVNDVGGACTDYGYAGNTHNLAVSEHDWFADGTVTPGFDTAIARDLDMFGRREAPLSIDELRAHEFDASLRFERMLEPGPGFSASLVSYRSGGLNVYAYLAVPTASPPARGFPVLIANHGYHPDPAAYGFTDDGRDRRPGDYYRSVPAWYTREGFVVVMPDYRGHNVSEGTSYTGSFLSTAWYSEDVLALLSAIDTLPNVDAANVFAWGHSMGGDVTLRAVVGTDRFRAASIWSATVGGLEEMTRYYAIHDAPANDDGNVAPNDWDKLRQVVALLGDGFDAGTRDPLRYLDRLSTPLIVQHGAGDVTVPIAWARRLTDTLAQRGHQVEFYRYDTDAHLFEGADLARAVARDVAFFRARMVYSEVANPSANAN